MTALPIHDPGWSQGRADGCTVCATQDTDEVCGCHGRRCLNHLAHEDEAEEASCHS